MSSKKNNRTRRIFISDIHMGDKRSINPPPPYAKPYGWLSEERADLLADFLENEIIESDKVKELIILGDLLDEWVCPTGLDPAKFLEVLDAKHNSRAVENLRKIASPAVDVDLYYAPGNHDMLLGKDFMEEHFKGIHFCEDPKKKEFIGVFQAEADGIAAEHGSQYTFFCAPNPGQFGGHWLPIGFFLSRVAAEKNAHHGGKPDILDILENFIRQFMDQPEFTKDLFLAIAKDCGLKEDSQIKMAGLDNFPAALTVKDVGNIYADAVKQWDAVKPNDLCSSAAIYNELAGLRGPAMKEYFLPNKARIVVCGHTHHAMLIGMNRDANYFHTFDQNGCGYLYANSGTWIDTHDCSFIETEIKGNRHFVRWYEYKDNRKRKKQKERFIYLK